MPFKMTSILIFSISIFGCSNEKNNSLFSHQDASYIEAADADTLKNNQALLKSVVHFANLKNGSCTATLIQKDVLLTAKHCVDIYNPKGIINSVAATSIETIVSPDTDLAIVKFVSNKNLNKKLVGAKPIQIALQADETLFTGNVLLAGYGITNAESDSGTLYAGQNTVAEGDPVSKAKLHTLIGPQSGSKYPLRSDYIHLMARRLTTYESFDYVEGFTVSADGGLYYSANVGLEQYVESKSIALPGDSGGALIAFKNNQAIIIGVTSDVCVTCAGSIVKEVTILDQRLKTEKTIVVDENMNGNGRSINATLLKVLAQAGVLDQDPDYKEGFITNTDFSFEFKMDRMAVNGYVSTTHAANSKFISETLKKFGY